MLQNIYDFDKILVDLKLDKTGKQFLKYGHTCICPIYIIPTYKTPQRLWIMLRG